ncbi:MAG: glycosyl transferase group 1 [Proteobacteria bacterium]|nr:glycosyl transferase group 1 [Pseudomonadota bacterium]
MCPESTTARQYSINMVSLRMRHHAGASGYDRIADYIDGNLIHTGRELGFFDRLVARMLKGRIRASGLTWYHRECLLAELAVAKQWMKKTGQVFHYLYGENLFRYAGVLPRIRKGNVIVCTYHTPENRFREVVRDRSFLRNADAIIVVSRIQKQIFADCVPEERIFYVPHGIDTEIFSPAPADDREEERPLRCITVGSHLRDYATLADAARLIEKENPDISLDVVTRPDLFGHFAGAKNVNLHSGVCDEAFLSMYRSADVAVLPMLDATANNSLLEAMACGLPVISTDLPAVRDYVDDQCAVLTPKADASGLAEAVLDLSNDRRRLAAMGMSSRTKALEFDWRQVARQTLAVYDAAWASRT